VLRGFLDFDQGYPPRGARRRDIDMLVEDAAYAPIFARYGRYKRRHGVECDIYNISGKDGGGVRKHPYYPEALAKYVLAGRRLWKKKFYAPGARAHLLSFIYHIAYQKAEASKIDMFDPRKSVASKYCRELEALKEELGADLPFTLMDFHRLLKEAGYAIPYETLACTLRHDFKNEYKSFFRATICAEQKGEMNLFVIRTVATRKKAEEELLRRLREQYTLLAVKHIPLHVRLLKGHKMRGGKWRRGGYPCIAVVVYDPHPIPATAEDRKLHEFVLNSRQFVKREWREWFSKATGAKPSANPIHSTDNEAEAIGHLPLFFTPHEQEEIFTKLAGLRR
jgi:hypothetical protein